MNHIVDDEMDRRRKTADQPPGAGCNRVEYRLHIVGRTGDDFQDVGCRGLPLQRLLRLVEHPRVLDRNYGLIGEGLKQPLFGGVESPHGLGS